MTDKSSLNVSSIIEDHSISESEIEELLHIDDEYEYWEFQDISIDSGVFGELVDLGIVTKNSSGYSLAYSKELQSIVDDQNPASTDSTDQDAFLGYIYKPYFQKVSEIVSIYTLLLFVIFLAGGYLRFRNLGNDPFWVDEMWHIWAADGYISGNGFTLPGGKSYTRAWSTVTLPVSLVFWALQPTEAVARAPTAVTGSALIIVSYYFGREFLNKPAGLILSGLVAFDAWTLTWSQQVRMYTHVQLLFILTLILFYTWWSRDDLRLYSPYLYALIPVGVLGYQTHLSYLGVGGILAIFTCSVYLYNTYLSRWTSVTVNTTRYKKQQLLVVVFCAAGALMIIWKGIPDLLLGHTPAWYESSRGAGFYWEFLQERNFALYILPFWVGTLYLLYRDAAGRLLVLSFYLPFVVYGYIAEFIIPRYIFHLYPIYLLIAVSPIAVIVDRIDVENLVSRFRPTAEFPEWLVGRMSTESAVKVVACVLLILLLVSPSTALHTVDNRSHGLIDDRSDHKGPSQYLTGNVSEDDLIFSSSPILTRWYYDDVDYALKYTGVDTENLSGSILSHDPDEIESILKNKSGWIVIDHRYHWYAPDEIKKVVEENSIQVAEGWNGITIRYFGDVVTDENWEERAASTNGKVNTIDNHISLGRTTDGGAQETGEMIFEVNDPEHLRIRSFGQGERFVNVYGSTDGEEWEQLLTHDDGGWKTQEAELSGEYLYIRVRGGSPGNDLGGLVEYMLIR
ncbi:hypothetical protein [Halorubrum ezzemoulense]|uniref:hypothetical protein n=1 Tax=Halorubrum ezzemoulense TaxID=337243 RepID=UPI00117A46C8|nr:hypothetical protein [Halorubrum ezzemoulense]